VLIHEILYFETFAKAHALGLKVTLHQSRFSVSFVRLVRWESIVICLLYVYLWNINCVLLHGPSSRLSLELDHRV